MDGAFSRTDCQSCRELFNAEISERERTQYLMHLGVLTNPVIGRRAAHHPFECLTRTLLFMTKDPITKPSEIPALQPNLFLGRAASPATVSVLLFTHMQLPRKRTSWTSNPMAGQEIRLAAMATWPRPPSLRKSIASTPVANQPLADSANERSHSWG